MTSADFSECKEALYAVLVSPRRSYNSRKKFKSVNDAYNSLGDAINECRTYTYLFGDTISSTERRRFMCAIKTLELTLDMHRARL